MVARSGLDLLQAVFVERTVAAAAGGSVRTREAAFGAVHRAGFEVGRRLGERMTVGKPRLGETLAVFRFVCKEVWTVLHGKAVDSLRSDGRVRGRGEGVW